MPKPFRMSLAAAFILFAHSAAPVAVEAPSALATAPVATMVSVRASATVLRPALITFSGNAAADQSLGQSAVDAQRQRDVHGTIWIEFS